MTMLLVLAIPAGLLALTLTLLYPRGSADGSSGAVLDLDDSQVAVLPDRVRLVRLDASTSGAAGSLAPLAAKLAVQGFEDAGTFTVDGIPDVTVWLLANRAQSIYATLADHAVAGVWYEFTTLYPGGGKWTITTLAGAGLDSRPGHTVVRDRGADLLELYLRACSERPLGVFLPATAEQAAAEFENGYAMWMTWRRAHDRTRAASAEAA